jgi:dihydroorotase
LEKDLPFDEAAFGIIGLETAVPLTLQLVRDKKLSALRAIALLTSGPAACLGLPLGTLIPGSIADVTVIAPERPWTAARFVSRSQNSPFLGTKLVGQAALTMVAGKVVYENFEGEP